MLRFNIEEHNLKELEKYGFINNQKVVNAFDGLITLSFYGDNYKVKMSCEVDDTYYLDEELETLYDLIKDGLILKE